MSRYIDADALIAKWEEDIKHITNASFRAMMQGAINEVSNAPIADVVDRNECSKCVLYPFKQLRGQLETNMVEVVHGEWIDTNPSEPLDPRITCSICGNTEVLFKGNFCPNCGADMRERREDAEIH